MFPYDCEGIVIWLSLQILFTFFNCIFIPHFVSTFSPPEVPKVLTLINAIFYRPFSLSPSGHACFLERAASADRGKKEARPMGQGWGGRHAARGGAAALRAPLRVGGGGGCKTAPCAYP